MTLFFANGSFGNVQTPFLYECQILLHLLNDSRKKKKYFLFGSGNFPMLPEFQYYIGVYLSLTLVQPTTIKYRQNQVCVVRPTQKTDQKLLSKGTFLFI